jgi:transcription initiation factor IIF auxiliary subunit
MSPNLRLRNKWEYVGNDRWKWVAYVDDGGTGDLSQVQSVRYILHPTFSKPVQTITQREGGFPIETSGWGTFELTAFARLRDGRDIKLRHDLQLEYDPKVGESA